MRNTLRLWLCAFVLLALFPAAAQRTGTVSLDLNGTWKDSRGRDVTITQQGTSVSIRFASGAVFSGEMHGRQLEVKHSLSFEETNKSLPTSVREQITGEEVRIVGNVSDDAASIEGTYYDRDPDWEHDQETDVYTVKGFKPGGRPMNFFRGDLKISDVTMDYTPWYIAQTELKRQLQSAKADLSRTEEALVTRQQEAERARAACVPKEARLEALKRQLAQAQLTGLGTGPPEAQKTRAYKALEGQINRLVLRQDQLYDRIVNARQYSSNISPQAMQRMLDEYDSNKVQERNLREQLKQMQDRMGYTATVEAAKRQAIDLDNAYYDAYKSYLKTELYDRELAEKRLVWAQEERNKAQDALGLIQESVDHLNPADSPNILTITASAENATRYDAEIWSPDILEKLNRDVRGLQAEVRRLNDIRGNAKNEFLTAGDQSLAATQALYRGIIESAATQAVIETGFNVWDIVEKGKSGGLAGAFAEAAKKAAEALILGAPSFAEPQVQEEFYSFAIDTPKDAGKLLGKRFVKSAVTGPAVKTAAERTIAQYMERKTASALAAAEAQFFQPGPWDSDLYISILRQREALEEARERVTKAVTANSTWRNMGSNLLQNVKKSFWDPKEKSYLKKSSFLTGVAKDVAKAQLKQWAADYFEGEAMKASMMADVELHARVGIFMSASATYWKARDLWEFKSAQRDELLEQYDPKNNLKVKTNTTFRTGVQLSVTFDTLDHRGNNHEFEVTIGGKRAQRSGGGLTYTVTTSDMQKDANGGVKLDVKILR